MSNEANECFCLLGMLVNQLVTSDVLFHWLSFVVFLITSDVKLSCKSLLPEKGKDYGVLGTGTSTSGYAGGREESRKP